MGQKNGCEFQERYKEGRKHDAGNIGGCEWCYTSTEESIHSRRCFMTGEYCSKQTNIQRERKKQYDGDEITITAFVIMNFSDMSDVVYKWRIKPFIESLSKYLYFSRSNGRLYCSKIEREDSIGNFQKVKKIRVVRSDSDPASNYVICSRICQQMQIADIVVVDVSSKNANVFYEFGMAVALGKMILPICYSESFYKMDEKLIDKYRAADGEKQHIGCYPWRKDLFEYYGIRYKRNPSGNTAYDEFSYATNDEHGFSDSKYRRFPYHEVISENQKRIGEEIYEKLKCEYNRASPDDNTLVVYTIEGFLNEHQAGLCIVNFYQSITARMRLEQCFCGERVGVLVQEKAIPEGEKDAEDESNLYYKVGEIIHIGVNQATYLAAEEKLKTDDGLKEPEILQEGNERELPKKEQREEIKRFVKEHIRNRGMLIYPNNPVYVNRMKNQLQDNILEVLEPESEEHCDCCKLDAFCLYHVMLRNLRYTNEIVVDITDNCLQSLFWLGAAHGSDVYAITVLHERTEKEQKITTGIAEKKSRNVFDVAGLWTAIFETKDTEGFYRQLALAQLGIERHSKLMAVKSEYYEKSIREYLFAFDAENERKMLEKLLDEKRDEESTLLESYYRKCFWNPMLRYNRLRIYLVQRNDNEDDAEPRMHTAKWDFDAVAALSHYLSKRTVIGEYLIKALSKDEKDEEAKKTNFICVGAFAQPLGFDLPTYIRGQLKYAVSDTERPYGGNVNIIHQRNKYIQRDGQCENYMFKGFTPLASEGKSLYTQHPVSKCLKCKHRTDEENEKVFYDESELASLSSCCLNQDGSHSEIAQLILWRENPDELHERSYFRVAMCGSSGPATFGLSALLVDEDQKKNYFVTKDNNEPKTEILPKDVDEIEDDKSKDKEKIYLLSQLQMIARKKFMDIFLLKLQEQLDTLTLRMNSVENDKNKEGGPEITGDQRRRYCSLVRHAASYYLSTVLYRYFLPFLSETDINRIHNGMHIYIHSMKAAKASPFALHYPAKGDRDYNTSVSDTSVNEVIELVPKVLLEVLKGFRGLEAFYKVNVVRRDSDGELSDRDTRYVRGIEMLRDENLGMNCFFIPEKQ